LKEAQREPPVDLSLPLEALQASFVLPLMAV
jgi:hypothetical protein